MFPTPIGASGSQRFNLGAPPQRFSSCRPFPGSPLFPSCRPFLSSSPVAGPYSAVPQLQALSQQFPSCRPFLSSSPVASPFSAVPQLQALSQQFPSGRSFASKWASGPSRARTPLASSCPRPSSSWDASLPPSSECLSGSSYYPCSWKARAKIGARVWHPAGMREVVGVWNRHGRGWVMMNKWCCESWQHLNGWGRPTSPPSHTTFTP